MKSRLYKIRPTHSCNTNSSTPGKQCYDSGSYTLLYGLQPSHNLLDQAVQDRIKKSWAAHSEAEVTKTGMLAL